VNYSLNLQAISKRQNYNELNIQLPISNRGLRKSIVRQSIDTVNSMIERKLRDSLAKNSRRSSFQIQQTSNCSAKIKQESNCANAMVHRDVTSPAK